MRIAIKPYRPEHDVDVNSLFAMNYLQELADNAHLVLSFAKRDIRAKYKQTILGVAWAVIQPVSLMIVFTLVFSLFARVPSEGIPYPIFSYSVLIFWTFFATSLSQGTVAMTANATLVRKIYFPRETLLLAVMLSALVDLGVAGLILVAMFVYYQVALSWAALWVIPLLALEVLFVLAVILMTSSLQVYFRDMGHALPLLLQLWMYASPIAYPLTSVPEWLRPFYLLNPMAGIIDGFRRALLHGEHPDFTYLGIACPVIVIALAGAYLFFKRAERTFADVI
jgi:lipopolysaccharide transport system permease protein